MATAHALVPGSAVSIHRAGPNETEAAFAIVEEYNRAVGVVVRDTPESFAADYFGDGGGVWLASADREIIGCIALRPLPQRERSGPELAGEVKRLYLRPEFRGRGIADALLSSLETYAAAHGYKWLYLDTKSDLHAAIRFYLRKGYEACERYNNNPQATLFLRKPLRAQPSV